jgi:TolA-binding protein
LVVQIFAFARHSADLGSLDEMLIETRDRLSRPGRGPADRVQSTLDWINVLYPVLRAGHQVPSSLAALLAGPGPSAEAKAVRSAALGEAAHREATAALHRGDVDQARAWQRLAHDNGHRTGAAIPAPQRPMVDLTGRHRHPRIAALLNASGLAAGYLYLGRWARAAVTVTVTALVVWFAAAHTASKSPTLWFTIIALGVGAATYDAWRLARPPHAMATADPVPRRSLAAAVALLLLVVAGFVGYQAAGRSALADAHAAYAAGDCPAALDRYARVQARYELTLTSVTSTARVDRRECHDLLLAEAALASGSYGSAPGMFDAQVRSYPDGLLVARARTGRAEAYLRRGKQKLARAVEQKDGAETVSLQRDAVADYTVIATDHAGTPQDAAVRSDLDKTYAAALAAAGTQPCTALPVLTYLGSVTLEAARTGAARARAALPGALYGCGLADLKAARYSSAIEHLTTFIKDYPRDSRVPDARQKRIAAEVAKVGAGTTGDLAPLERTGTGPSGTATVQVVNDSPYALEILYSGPVAAQLTIPRCAACTVRSAPSLLNRYFGGTTCGGDGVPSRTLRLRPGSYQVVVRTSASGGPRPYSGSWRLAGGARYDNCYYASRAFG